MSIVHVQVLLLFAAFWTAVLLYRGHRPARFVLGLGLGAAFTHLGWALLYWSRVLEHPMAVLDPALGYCVLFFPLGPLLAAREHATWRALPLALAVARAGCVVAGCCHGSVGPSGPYSTPLYEVALLVLLHFAVRAAPGPQAAAVFWLGFGLERLIVEPWRAPPPLGEPAVPPEALAALWAGAGLLRMAVGLRPRLERRSRRAEAALEPHRQGTPARRMAG